MTILSSPSGVYDRFLSPDGEPRLRKWTRAEYYRMADLGLLRPEDHVELIDGEILLKWTEGPDRKQWTCEQFEFMGDVGLLGAEERVELIDGDVLEMSPQRTPHATGVTLAYQALLRLFPDTPLVRVQLPLRLYGTVQPEPDIAVVPGSARDYQHSHPETALMVWEISDTTIQFDRTVKAGLYASAGIPEYWITDLINNRIEIRRDPIVMTGEAYDHGYRSVTLHLGSETVTPLFAPESREAVSDVLI
jgi:Uma2 family endonuclease